MANLTNPTPLNVAPPAQASGTPPAVKGSPANVENKPPTMAIAGHTAGPPGSAAPHDRPTQLAVAGHTTVATTYANVSTQKKGGT